MTTKDYNIANYALKSEYEAYDMYTDMIKAADDPELKKVLKHNKKEEYEHIKLLKRAILKGSV